MSDLRHGFENNYAHKHLPSKWHTSGYTHYPEAPLTRASFRDPQMPAWRGELVPKDTQYSERQQDKTLHMSSYGCHRENPWHGSLRSPRNPKPGATTREAQYTGERLCNASWSPRERRLGPRPLTQALHAQHEHRRHQERQLDQTSPQKGRGQRASPSKKPSAALRRYEEEDGDDSGEGSDSDDGEMNLEAIRRRYTATTKKKGSRTPR
mmetsp:Transcript_85999/g.277781  ORF Transcript_85999/g.277781 Transcript_85999/m.277781 type:complete len:209 (-) Transcript_85999:228-854(-)